MTNEQFRKHKILKEYTHLNSARKTKITDYCALLTKLTRVTQNISPMPGHGGGSDYDERVFELAEKYVEIEAITDKIAAVQVAINNLSLTEGFVIREYYFHHRSASEIGEMIEKSKRSIFRIRNDALDHLNL